MFGKHGKLNKKTGELACPKCGCTRLVTKQKGYGLFKGALGAATVGPAGFALGHIGSHKTKVVCAHCKYSWKL